ncbi:replication endonuclease [Aliarcobacter butzleri]
MTYEKYLKYERLQYIEHSKEKENKQAKYKAKLETFNNVTGEFKSLNHNPLHVSRDNYLWFTYNQKLLEEQIISNAEFATLFITLTLPSTFHKYSTTNKKLNPLFKEENTINEGYKLLNSSFREVYKNFRVNRRFEKIYFSKVIEPHKSFTCHLHAILYVKIEFIENLKNHIKNVVKKNQLGRYEIEDIKDITRGTSYLLKYVQKTTNPSNDEDFHFFNGWKKWNKIRVFTCSIVGLERFLFKKINACTNLTKNLKGNPITKILSKCDINIVTTNTKTNEIKTKKHSSGKSRYIVNLEKEKFKLDINYLPNEKNLKRIYFDSFKNGNSNNIMKTYNLREFLKFCKINFDSISGYNKKHKIKLIEKYINYINDFENFKLIDKMQKIDNIIESFLNDTKLENYEFSEFDIDNHGKEFTNIEIEDIESFDKLENFKSIFDNIYISKYKYKIKNITIFDKKINCEIYSSNSFEILWKMV